MRDRSLRVAQNIRDSDIRSALYMIRTGNEPKDETYIRDIRKEGFSLDAQRLATMKWR